MLENQETLRADDLPLISCHALRHHEKTKRNTGQVFQRPGPVNHVALARSATEGEILVLHPNVCYALGPRNRALL